MVGELVLRIMCCDACMRACNVVCVHAMHVCMHTCNVFMYVCIAVMLSF